MIQNLQVPNGLNLPGNPNANDAVSLPRRSPRQRQVRVQKNPGVSKKTENKAKNQEINGRKAKESKSQPAPLMVPAPAANPEAEVGQLPASALVTTDAEKEIGQPPAPVENPEAGADQLPASALVTTDAKTEIGQPPAPVENPEAGADPEEKSWVYATVGFVVFVGASAAVITIIKKASNKLFEMKEAKKKANAQNEELNAEIKRLKEEVKSLGEEAKKLNAEIKKLSDPTKDEKLNAEIKKLSEEAKKLNEEVKGLREKHKELLKQKADPKKAEEAAAQKEAEAARKEAEQKADPKKAEEAAAQKEAEVARKEAEQKAEAEAAAQKKAEAARKEEPKDEKPICQKGYVIIDGVKKTVYTDIRLYNDALRLRVPAIWIGDARKNYGYSY